ncbi:MAG: class I SAM-dependent methyltransferase, partial [Planctomycetales bacterium]
RIVSVEMFEHLRNYERILERISSWLRPGGKLYIHVFCHRDVPYVFETDGAVNWMGKHFFTGGMMPCRDLFHQFNRHLNVVSQWTWEGRHYQKTAEAWLSNLDDRRRNLLPLLESVYGRGRGRLWLRRWRMFFMAVAELFAFDQGREWFVSHCLLESAN